MATNSIESLFPLDALKAPLIPNPTTNQQMLLNHFRLKYRSFFVEYFPHEGAVMLPTMFSQDFGDDISRFVYLNDLHGNKFEILVEKINENVYFTRGWASLRDFYNIRTGAWLILTYLGFGKFWLGVRNELHYSVTPPTFDPPLSFNIDKSGVSPSFVPDLPESIKLLSYSHDESIFRFVHQKQITYYDLSMGSLIIPYKGFGDIVFDRAATSVKLVDDCGNIWSCTLGFVEVPFSHVRIGGEWNVMVGARRICVGRSIRIGAKANGHNETIYCIVGP